MSQNFAVFSASSSAAASPFELLAFELLTQNQMKIFQDQAQQSTLWAEASGKMSQAIKASGESQADATENNGYGQMLAGLGGVTGATASGLHDTFAMPRDAQMISARNDLNTVKGNAEFLNGGYAKEFGPNAEEQAQIALGHVARNPATENELNQVRNWDLKKNLKGQGLSAAVEHIKDNEPETFNQKLQDASAAQRHAETQVQHREGQLQGRSQTITYFLQGFGQSVGGGYFSGAMASQAQNAQATQDAMRQAFDTVTNSFKSNSDTNGANASKMDDQKSFVFQIMQGLASANAA